MKRSAINKAIQRTLQVLEANNYKLPAFGYWDLETWRKNKDKVGEITQLMLGWDVTDYGEDAFEKAGAVLFTVRNGNINDPTLGTPYAEKIIYVCHQSEQEIPFHFHRLKTEDIINRAGGTLMLELYNSTADNRLDKNSDVVVKMDGITHRFAPGEFVSVKPGCSITLAPGLFHRFWADRASGPLVIGEVSSINDDLCDNVFLNPIKRFSDIEEDELPIHPLCIEYETLLS